MAEDKDQKALRLFLGAMSLQEIRTVLNFKTVSSAEAAIRRALAANRKGKDRDTERSAELERIDALYRAAYPQAIQGDLKAIDSCNTLSERRMRILDKPDDGATITSNYEATVAALDTTEADAAAIASGRAIARQIDYSLQHGTGQEVTKALYLVPHLMNVLRELGATPAARGNIQNAAKEVKPVADELEEYLAKIS
ncbi:terminase small subunit [Bifidobacterium longum]|uniref:terminase small subunit n=1 Tax=Bifidobacterium longum TaxID=216816 RepID=UPI003D00F1D1